MFERFTKSAREVVVAAQPLARELSDPTIGCRHLLLALAAQPGPAGESLAAAGLTEAGLREAMTKRAATDLDDAAALGSLGIDLVAIRRAAEERFGPGALDRAQERLGRRRRFGRSVGGHIPFTSEAKRVLELSLRETIRLNSGAIGPEHLLLGVLRSGDADTALLFAALGVDPAGVAADVEVRLRRSA